MTSTPTRTSRSSPVRTAPHPRAFIELTGVEEKNADGKKVDNTTEAAAIQSSTNGVMTAVANDETLCVHQPRLSEQ